MPHTVPGRTLPAVALGIALAATALLVPSGTPARAEAGPLSSADAGADRISSQRTLLVALEVDREEARLLSFTVKDRPFASPGNSSPVRPHAAAGLEQIEFVLLGPGQARHVSRLDLPGLCLGHGPATPPEITGDRIRLHRESIVIEEPEIAGFDRMEIATYEGPGLATARRTIGLVELDGAHFTSAGTSLRYEDLAFADGPSLPMAPAQLTPGTVHWPEEYGDPELVTIFGDPAETSKRINVVIVPDGYTYAQKAEMQAHAQGVVDVFRSMSPFREHDRFFNYALVYAYSSQAGPDQCDCGVIRDTAMNTAFPDYGYPCGHTENRCLYYGSACDRPDPSEQHITQAEMRAPAVDATIVMVNTSRYGGCGGYRAVFSAGSPWGPYIAIHEMGHSLAGLGDEYGGYQYCGSYAGEINTSLNGSTGAWPEWIPDIGSPYEGAEYYNQCIYRPTGSCMMRALNSQFCPVCRQQLALTVFGHGRVRPTAPVESSSPASPVYASPGEPVTYSLATRLPEWGATSRVAWQLSGPDPSSPVTVATDTDTYTHSYSEPGTYTLAGEVVADTNLIKPVKNGPNVDRVAWTTMICDPACAVMPPSHTTLECSAAGGVPSTDPRAASWLDSASAAPSCVEPSVSNDAPALLPSACAPGSGTTVSFTVRDACGHSSSASSVATVADTAPPSGAITFPSPGACLGPPALPVTVTDSLRDVCDPSVTRSYDPPPGPGYDAHGDHHVTVAASDGCGNASSGSVDFTIDLRAPTVRILGPPDGGLSLPATLPFRIAFTAADDDGAAGGVVHEIIKLQDCVIYDGSTYGDGDGLLSDESVTLDVPELCRISALCGITNLTRPTIRAEATDCGGNRGSAARTFPGSVTLFPGLCAR